MKKTLIIGSLLIVVLFICGCAVSDYISGGSVADKDAPAAEGEEQAAAEDISDEAELEKIIEEIDAENKEEVVEETTDAEETTEGETTEDSTEVVPEEETAEDEAADGTPITITIKENQTVSLKPKANDADNDKIVYTFSEPLDANGRWQTKFGDAGEYMITVTASDSKLETTKKVLLVVERVNVAPQITGVLSNITVNEGDTLELAPKVSDPNKDETTVKFSEPVGEDGTWAIGYKEAGDYTVTITASDGELETVQKIQVNVNKKNVAPTISNVPDTMAVKEGEIVTINPKVEDLNGDEVDVTISDPVGNSGLWETGFDDNGEYNIVVTASDGQATTKKEFKLVVEDVNVAPVIEDITNQG